MIARVWEGAVLLDKAEPYGRYLADSDRGVRDYRQIPGNRGVWLMRRWQGDRVRFLLVSLWESREAIAAYAGDDIDKARYFPFDLECLIDPPVEVEHWEVMGDGR
jgi:hypothetical protein